VRLGNYWAWRERIILPWGICRAGALRIVLRIRIGVRVRDCSEVGDWPGLGLEDCSSLGDFSGVLVHFGLAQEDWSPEHLTQRGQALALLLEYSSGSEGVP